MVDDGSVGQGPRDVARALLFDEGGRVLLVHWRDPLTGREFLEPPGGAREPGETYEDALRREIAEETGIGGVEVGAFAAERRHEFTFGGRGYDRLERYYLCRVVRRERGETHLDPVEAEGIVGVEWWDVDDLGASSLSLEPPGLLEMLRLNPASPGENHASDAGRAARAEEDGWTGSTSVPS